MIACSCVHVSHTQVCLSRCVWDIYYEELRAWRAEQVLLHNVWRTQLHFTHHFYPLCVNLLYTDLPHKACEACDAFASWSWSQPRRHPTLSAEHAGGFNLLHHCVQDPHAEAKLDPFLALEQRLQAQAEERAAVPTEETKP
jgi:hypothetical protein